jgi:hypothetical protein
MLRPAGTIAGNDNPLIAKRELLLLAAVIVTFAPVALRVPVAVPLVPSKTLPTATGAGPTLSCPATAEPLPVSATVKVGLDPLDVTVTLPLALVADVGVKVTVKLAVFPAATVAGVEIPLSTKPVPVTAT